MFILYHKSLRPCLELQKVIIEDAMQILILWLCVPEEKKKVY